MSGIVARLHRGPFPSIQPLGMLRLGFVALEGYSSPFSATARLVFAGNGDEGAIAVVSGAGGLRYVCAGSPRGRSRLSGAGVLRLLGTGGLTAGVSTHALAADAIVVVSVAGGITNVPVSRKRGPYPTILALGLVQLGDISLVGPIRAISGKLFRVVNSTGAGGIAIGSEIAGTLFRPGVSAEDNWILLRHKEDN